MDTRKEALLQALRTWINQRPGLDTRDYDRASYRSEARQITQDRNDAIEILTAVALRGDIHADDILEASKSAFNGRLAIIETAPGEFEIDYCIGQHWPTEYRKAAAAVLASAYWSTYREWHFRSVAKQPTGDQMRSFFREEFGPAIQGRWFN